MGCPLTGGRKQKKNPIFSFKNFLVRLRESVRLRECVNTEFDWKVKRGFEKASVSRAVRLQECLLAQTLLYNSIMIELKLEQCYYLPGGDSHI